MSAKKGDDIQAECFVKLFELYPIYRRVICKLFDAKEFRFTKTQQMIIMTLWLYKKTSLSQLATLISTSNEQATRAVGQLVKMGYVTRERNEENRRLAEIQLTPKAEEAVMESQKMVRERFPNSLAHFSDKDAAELYDSLSRTGEILMKAERELLAVENIDV